VLDEAAQTARIHYRGRGAAQTRGPEAGSDAGAASGASALSAWAAFGLYTAAFLALAAWLSGAVAIPYDAKSQFYPQLAFLARSLAAGQSPFWTPNVFAGWPRLPIRNR
jgi:hypothetical protein